MSDTSRRLGGGADLTVDGLGFSVVDEPQFRLATVAREAMKSMTSGFDGYKESPETPYIEANLRDMPGISIADFEGMTNVTVELRRNNGKVVVGQGLTCMTAIEVNVSDAKFKVRFEGDNISEETA